MKNISLFKVLSTVYHVYIKAQNAHWNVKGSDFMSAHEFFELIYNNKKDFIDEIAERMSQLGDVVNANFSNYLKYSVLKDDTSDMISFESGLKELLLGYEGLKKLCDSCIKEYADDYVTCDLITRLSCLVEKEKWLIKSHLS